MVIRVNIRVNILGLILIGLPLISLRGLSMELCPLLVFLYSE